MTQSDNSDFTPRHRSSFIQKLSFGFGMSIPICFVNVVVQFSHTLYVVGLGLNPLFLGFAHMLSRLSDAIIDPWVGHLSDNTRTRWGRRKPFLLIGGILASISLILVWTPPSDSSQTIIMGYYFLVTLLFYCSVSIFSIPLNALGYEMATDYHERTKVFCYAAFIGNSFALLTPWMSRLSRNEIFPDTSAGVQFIGIVFGILILIASIIACIFCSEPSKEKVQTQEKISFINNTKLTMRDSNFLCLIIAIMAITTGYGFVTNFANSIMIFYLFPGNEAGSTQQLGINGTVWALSSILAVFPVNWLSKQIGKSKTMQLCITFMIFGNLLKIVCYDPSQPWLSIFPTICIAAGMLGVYTLAGSMIADICDQDELDHGKRREGSYCSLFSWWITTSSALGYMVAGQLFELIGFKENSEIQAEITLQLMQILDITLPTILCIIGFLVLRPYSLSKEKVLIIQSELRNKATT